VPILDLLDEQQSSEEMQIPSANDWINIHNPLSLVLAPVAALGFVILVIWAVVQLL
jgi:hypothetical protein